MTTIHLRREYLADRQPIDDLVILKLEHWEDLCEHSRRWKATVLHLEQRIKALEDAAKPKEKPKRWRWF